MKAKKASGGGIAREEKLAPPNELYDHTIHISFTQLVATLNMNRVAIQRMIDAGYILRGKDLLYPLHSAVQGALRYTKDTGLKRGTGREQAAVRVQEARARSIDQATALQAKELIPLADACALIDLLIGGAKAELDGMPAQLTRDRTLRVEYERKFSEMMQRLSDRWERLAKTGDEEETTDEEET